MTNWLIYLLEVSFCHTFLYILYFGVFRNLSFFQINRFYLLVATILGFIIPAIQIPFWEYHTSDLLPLKLTEIPIPLNDKTNTNNPTSYLTWSFNLIFIIYLIGLILHFLKLSGTIIKVYSLIKNPKVDEYSGIKTVHLENGPAIFVFLSYVFINMKKMNISSEEYRQVIEHEKSHVIQKHTLDNILIGLAATVCWFNPILKLIKKELNNAHEFYADRKVIDDSQDLDSYSRLILSLSKTQKDHIPLTHQFSMYNIKRRIIMLNKKKNNNYTLLRYAIVVPCMIVLLVSFSFVEKIPKVTINNEFKDTSLVIREIIWKGNTLYTSEFLSDYMGINEGDLFNESAINQKLYYQPEGDDLASLYMDKGYLFFSVDLKKEVQSGTVDLIFELYEGDIITIDKVFVTGNKTVDNEKILSMISLKSGDLFNRSRLTASQQRIVKSGLVDPENVIPYPIPNFGNGTVDIEFKVQER